MPSLPYQAFWRSRTPEAELSDRLNLTKYAYKLETNDLNKDRMRQGS